MTRNERFNDRMLSLDRKAAEMSDISKAPILSDHSEGVERMVNAIDHTEKSALSPTLYTQKLEAAVKRLTRANLGYLAATLRLIAKNLGNRQESIGCMKKRNRASWNVAEVLYFSQRKKLLNFFLGQ